MLHCFNKETEKECKNDLFDCKNQSNKSDIYESEKRVQIMIDCPGVNKENINISLQGDYLIIKIKRIQGFLDYDCTHQEIDYGESMRKFYLGENVTKDIDAKLENGVLFISYEKKKEDELEISIK